jgi:hypothetical protein
MSSTLFRKCIYTRINNITTSFALFAYMVGHCLPKFLRAAESFQIGYANTNVLPLLFLNDEKHHDATQVAAGAASPSVDSACTIKTATTTTASTSTNITSKINTSNNDGTAYIYGERVLQHPRALDSAVHFHRNGTASTAASARGGAFEGGCGRWVHF